MITATRNPARPIGAAPRTTKNAHPVEAPRTLSALTALAIADHIHAALAAAAFDSKLCRVPHPAAINWRTKFGNLTAWRPERVTSSA